MEQRLFQKLILAELVKEYPAFYEMKFEASLPHKQEPTTCPYPEPDEPNSYCLTLFLEDPAQYTCCMRYYCNNY